ncbi:DUF551 domain-containing protein [Salmonella enterica]|nr:MULTISPECIES: DUF551 domain-containing protein [Salmonella]EDJ1389342.1 hypothetical protein [Salmonella enterica subsp. enterica serovar Saintpaul]EDN1323306.1 hypothetical protein [Salmonella enterica subsp. enterica serovar Typhimurium]EHN8057690.1 DUF551 domain-containing protein [Salmonella enterica subsp. enterica serovar Infantis]EIS2578303.1 DUF551 domain-containing protein [Salmonella enterica subsp. enterica serovar Telelkebir]HDJ1975195.1 DUF551 domain-containing protein [Salmone
MNIDKQALCIENAFDIANQLYELANNEIECDLFAVTSTNENGTEIEFERPITDLALEAPSTINALLNRLEAAEKHIEAWGVKYIPLSGSSPVIPGGWISCSERMPDIQTDVLIATVYDNVLQALLIADRFIDPSGMDFHLDEVIGWMPLPDAPQQDILMKSSS